MSNAFQDPSQDPSQDLCGDFGGRGAGVRSADDSNVIRYPKHHAEEHAVLIDVASEDGALDVGQHAVRATANQGVTGHVACRGIENARNR
jgi:hypothetical protein